MDKMLISGNTHPGRRRKENQDAFIARALWSADRILLAVIDGVGGYAGGEKAAALAKNCIEQYMQMPSGDTMTMLREAVLFANNRIAEERKKDPHTSEMCCVLTAAVADAATASVYYVHVGDTRLYCYRNGQLQKITKDHSFVGIKEDAGEITEQEAMAHPHRNQILREVGALQHRLDDEDFMDYGREPLLPGDLLLLCSDGLTDMITSQQIGHLLSTGQPLVSKVNNLVGLANTNGGHDNITVVLLQHPVTEFNGTMPAGSLKVEETVAVNPPAPKPKKGGRGERMLLMGFLLLLVVAGAGWYFEAPRQAFIHAANPLPLPDTTESSNVVKPTLRETHAAVPGPVAVAAPQTDTLYLSATQNFADIKKHTDSTGKTLVLLPKKMRARFPAISINNRSGHAGDTLLISHLWLNGFETGFEIRLPFVLKTDNVVFENTTTAFRYLVQPNEKHAFLLYMNTAKQ